MSKKGSIVGIVFLFLVACPKPAKACTEFNSRGTCVTTEKMPDNTVVQKEFNREGKVIEESISYLNGSEIRKIFDPSGNIQNIIKYYNDNDVNNRRVIGNRDDERPSAVDKHAYFSGVKRRWIVENRVNEKLEGSYKEFDITGVLKIHLEFKNGKLNGEQKFENGESFFVFHMKNGELLETYTGAKHNVIRRIINDYW
ncbi:hypothetical protein [Leptospira tipperaryensis]|uniref:hypothetical protein n=1 Tax=Leptospira tipperaryensis TaxID=2564040 RepID=UPI0012EA8F80|nr:hypothetical protein [Leptospira tipperaryensis]